MAGNRYKDIIREVTHEVASTLDRLRVVWDDLGLCEDTRRDRTQVVILHLKNLLDDMLKEEELLRERYQEKIKKHSADLLRLTQDLGLPPYQPEEGLTNIQLEKELRKKVSTLETEKKERVDRLSRLKREDQHLCDVMCTTPYYVATGTVPNQTQLDELQSHIKGLKAEKEKRSSIFQTTKKSILKMLEDLDQCPNTSFERELICEDDDSFLLSSDNMRAIQKYNEELEQQQKMNFAQASKLRDQMETLWERLQIDDDVRNVFITEHIGFKPSVIRAIKQEISRLELLKIKNMQQVIEKAREELVKWWDNTYFGPSQREEFKEFTAEDYSEQVLQAHDIEVEKMKRYYENNIELLEIIGRRQELWKQFLEHERKAMDPNRYFNRGCNLLKEEKMRKKVTKELPKVEDDAKERIAAWEMSKGRHFLVNGVRYVDFLEQEWEDYRQSKEQEKSQRQKAKARLMEEEVKYGSRPVTTTPGKKRPNNPTTPGRTPNKKFKQNCGEPVAIYNSTVTSSVCSSASSSVSSSRSQTSQQTRHQPRPMRKMNDTTKTPSAITPGHNRTGRTNHTSVFSPVCMGSRSASRYHKTPTSNRHALSEKNSATSSNDTVFSHTTVSSGVPNNSSGKKEELDVEVSMASLGHYQEFARGLNQNARPNCRSSILPKPAYF